MDTVRREIWKRHPGLVWSNPEASDSVRIRAALLRPLFGCLLEIAVEFGLQRVKDEWDYLSVEQNREVARARMSVERILRNIGEGFRLAAA